MLLLLLYNSIYRDGTSAGVQATVPAVLIDPDGFNKGAGIRLPPLPLQLTSSSIICHRLQ
jgi:hypothetical protein